MVSCLSWRRTFALTLLAFVAACGGDRNSTGRDTGNRGGDELSEAAKQANHVREVVAAGGVVDSILPVAEALRRFRADLPPVDVLQHASPSRDALVTRLGRALQRRDTADLNAMVLSRAEFAWLFYESSPLSRPPYEAPPALLWGQILNGSDEGARQLMARLGGKSVRVMAISCPDTAEIEGSNRLHKRCEATFSAPDTPTLKGNLFGTILERDGRFKFVGLGNRI